MLTIFRVMTARTTFFELAYNGVNVKFASSLRDEQLLQAVDEHVATLVNGRPFELFWNDDASNVVLETVEDLAAAIDFAKSRKSLTSTPCVLLTVVTEGPMEQQMENAADDAITASPPIDLKPQLREKLTQLFSSARDEQWMTGLQSAMKPLFRRRSNDLQKPSDACAAEIAVQLIDLESRVPGELKLQLLQITQSERLEVFEEMERAAFCAVTAEPLDEESIANRKAAVNAVRLAVEMALDDRWEEDSDDEDEEEEKKEDEDLTSACWLTRSAALIMQLAETNLDSGWTRPVYRSPVEYLKQAATAACNRLEHAAEFPSHDRIDRMKKRLTRLPDSITDLQHTPIPYEIRRDSSNLHIIELNERIEQENDVEICTKSAIAELLSRTVDNVPEEMLQQLRALNPDQLAKVLLLDWVDRIAEERRAIEAVLTKDNACDEQATRCSVTTLEALLYAASAASMYPDELRHSVTVTIKKRNEKRNEKTALEYRGLYGADMSKGMRQSNVRRHIAESLEPYISYHKASAFVRLLLTPPAPPPKPVEKSILGYENRQWAELFESLKMTDEIKTYSSQLQGSPIHSEISAILQSHTQKASKKQLKKLQKMEADKISDTVLSDLFTGIFTEQRAAKRMQEENDLEPETQWIEYSTTKLAALLFMSAAASASVIRLQTQLSTYNIRRSAETGNHQATADATALQQELSAWVEAQAGAIVEQGRKRIDDVFVFMEQRRLMQHNRQLINNSMQPMAIQHVDILHQLPLPTVQETQQSALIAVQETSVPSEEDDFEIV